MKIKLLFPRGPLLALLWILILLPFISNAQEKNSIIIRGTVRSEKDQPVAGASVIIKGGQTGTTTNEQGEFGINAPGNATLVITALDYETREIMVNNRSAISISLKQAEKSLGEVVVIGYGTQKKKDITGSVARVNLETMKNSPNTNLGQLLQGTVPGLNVGTSTVAGGTPPISIRGQVTLNGNTSVLIILDGIQYNGSLSSINPDDIASIDILKDASATAVYGAQAANGVILITSRKGHAGQKPRIAYSGSYASNRPTVNLRPLNREEYLQRVTDAFWRQAYLAPDYTTPNPTFNLASK